MNQRNLTNIGIAFGIMIALFSASIIPAINAIDYSSNDNLKETTIDDEFDYTHTVLGEQGTATWCVHCPPVAGYLWTLYSSENYDFHYVALVDDKLTQAASRIDELGLTGFPTVFFDGGYNDVVGNVGSTGPYITAMNACGARNVADIDLEVWLVWNGNNEVEVTVNVTNNEGSTYSGHLHAYVTEIISRWDDYVGDPYRYAMVGYAFNQDISVSSGATNQYVDTFNYPDLEKNNVQVVASVFASSTMYTDETAAYAFDPEPDTTLDSISEYVSTLNDITGTAEDTQSRFHPEEISGVKLSLQDITESTYWDGDSWESSQVWLDADPVDGAFDEEEEDWIYDSSSTIFTNVHEYEVAAKAIDLIEQEDQEPASTTFTYDNVPPETIFEEIPSGTIWYNDVFIEWTASDDQIPVDDLRYSYMLEGYDADWSGWLALDHRTYMNLNPGTTYTFKAKARDTAGNEDPTPAEQSFTIGNDVTGPETIITSGTSGIINDNKASFIFEASDDHTPTEEILFSYKLMGYDESWSSWSTKTDKNFYNLEDGTYTFIVKSKDNMDNEDADPPSQTFTVETSGAPDTEITSGPEGIIDIGEATFEWTATDDSTPTPDLLYSYKLEGYETSWSEWSSLTTVDYTNLQHGEYTFMVKAKDEGENEDPSPAERTFAYTSAPSNPTIDGPSRAKKGETHDYTVASTDPEGDDVLYWIEWYEGDPSASWQGPHSSGQEVEFSNSWEEEGSYTIRVKAKDSYGAESDWTSFEVEMPKTKHSYFSILNFIYRLIEKIPILQNLNFFSLFL